MYNFKVKNRAVLFVLVILLMAGGQKAAFAEEAVPLKESGIYDVLWNDAPIRSSMVLINGVTYIPAESFAEAAEFSFEQQENKLIYREKDNGYILRFVSGAGMEKRDGFSGEIDNSGTLSLYSSCFSMGSAKPDSGEFFSESREKCVKLGENDFEEIKSILSSLPENDMCETGKERDERGIEIYYGKGSYTFFYESTENDSLRRLMDIIDRALEMEPENIQPEYKAEQVPEVKTEILGKMPEFKNPVVKVDGVYYVPLREYAESLGFEVVWLQEYGEIRVYKVEKDFILRMCAMERYSFYTYEVTNDGRLLVYNNYNSEYDYKTESGFKHVCKAVKKKEIQLDGEELAQIKKYLDEVSKCEEFHLISFEFTCAALYFDGKEYFYDTFYPEFNESERVMQPLLDYLKELAKD